MRRKVATSLLQERDQQGSQAASTTHNGRLENGIPLRSLATDIFLSAGGINLMGTYRKLMTRAAAVWQRATG
jgi:hypothetical protein